MWAGGHRLQTLKNLGSWDKMKNNRENLSPFGIKNHRRHSHKGFLSTGLQRDICVPQGGECGERYRMTPWSEGRKYGSFYF